MRHPPEIPGLDRSALARVHGGYSAALFEQMKKAVSMGLTINSTWTGQHGSSSAGASHYAGRAFDSIGSQEQMWRFYHHAVTTNPHEVIFHNKYIEDGRPHAPMGGHDTHIHFSK